MVYYGNKQGLVADLRRIMPPDNCYNEYLELCAGTASVCRKLISRNKVRTVVEKDHGQATLLKVIKEQPAELANHLLRIGYNADDFGDALELKGKGYCGCCDMKVAVARRILTNQSFNATCTTYRDISRGEENDVRCAISADRMRGAYARHIIPDCMNTSSELEGVNIIEGDMFDYLDRLSEKNTFIFIDPPYNPKLRKAGKKGYDQDWETEMHTQFLMTIRDMHESDNLKAFVMICCYVDINNMKEDLYCSYLLRSGFKLILLKEVYAPKVVSSRVHSKRKSKALECVFINYEPVAEWAALDKSKLISYEDVYVTEKN